jgi:hypothetical protein
MKDSSLVPLSYYVNLDSPLKVNNQNLLTYSENFSSSNWGYYNGVKIVSASNVLSPNSVTYAQIISGSNSISQDTAYWTSGVNIAQYTFSIYVHNSSTATTITPTIWYLPVNWPTIGKQINGSVNFNPQNGQYTGKTLLGSNGVKVDSYNSEYVGNGWYRYSVTTSQTSSIPLSIRCELYYNTILSNPPNNIVAWGAQLEKNNFGAYTKTLGTPIVSLNEEGFANLKRVEPSLGIPSVSSLANANSAYYFLVAAKDLTNAKSRRFTGQDSLFLSGNRLSYNNLNPKYDFDISGNFKSLSAYFNVLSTNNLMGAGGNNTLSINSFSSIQIDSNLTDYGNAYFNYLSADNIIVTSLSSLSSRYDIFNNSPLSDNEIFSSITWNVTAGDDVFATNINAKNRITTLFLSANNSFFTNLSTDNLTVKYNLSAKSLSASNLYGFLNLDPLSELYYNGNILSSRLSASYFFGIKPSDSYSTDNISYVRTLSGAWDGSNGSIIETLPVLKPYFKNISQILSYVNLHGLYGEELSLLLYDDIEPNNINTDGTTSIAACTSSGNIHVKYYPTSSLPTFLQNAGVKGGNFIWPLNNSVPINGIISYLGVGDLNFENFNMVGMYEIGTTTNVSGKKQYTYEKPFNVAPRKISIRNYVCVNPSLTYGNFGSDATDWTSLYTDPNSRVQNRPLFFNGGNKTDINLQNLCFEFDSNCNDSTALWFTGGQNYVSNVTIATLGTANYYYGALNANRCDVYVCGVNQIDPYLLTSPTNWTRWVELSGAINQSYYPGYGLAIIGNPSSRNYPSLIPSSIFDCFRSKIFIKDYNTNRRVGRNSQLNAGVILDGNFNTRALYQLDEHAKIQSNNHIFRTLNFSVSNLNCDYYSGTNSSGDYKNAYFNTNIDNFYYIYFASSYCTLQAQYYQMPYWEFKDKNPLSLHPNDNNQIAAKLVSSPSNYIFNTTTNSINLSAMVFGTYVKNVLENSDINDSYNLYNYISPNNLPLYNTSGLYNLVSPIGGLNYILNYYS